MNAITKTIRDFGSSFTHKKAPLTKGSTLQLPSELLGELAEWQVGRDSVCWVNCEGSICIIESTGLINERESCRDSFLSYAGDMLYVQEDDASLSEIGPYGSVRILDEYRDFSWRPGKSGEVFLRSGDAFSVVSALEKGRIVLGEVRVDTRGHEPWLESIRHPTVWDVVPNGLYVRVSDSFFELDRTGTLRHLGTQECDESQPGIMGIFLSKKKGDRRQFWHLTYQGVKVYLGSFPCEKWDAASDRIYIEYKGVLSRVIDGGRSLFKGKGRGVSEVIADVKGAHSWRPDAQGLWILRDGFFSRVADPLTRVNNLWWYSNPVICFMNEPIMQEAQSRF